MKSRDTKSQPPAGGEQQRKAQPRSTAPGVDQTRQRNEGTNRDQGRNVGDSGAAGHARRH